jgi:hypothetical protein
VGLFYCNADRLNMVHTSSRSVLRIPTHAEHLF